MDGHVIEFLPKADGGFDGMRPDRYVQCTGALNSICLLYTSNILAERKDLLDKLPVGSIITPHPGEFDRLFGEQDDHYSRFATAQREAQQRKINIVLKGGITIICQSNGVSFFNTRGNPGMATGGSGDVLTGVILGLLSQGYSSDYASLLGVYIHASAGDLAAEEQGYESLICLLYTSRCV